MASFSRDDVAVARVISEDEGFMLLEVMKDETQTFHLDPAVENNRFYTLVFVRFENGVPSFVKPWQ